MRTLLCPLVLCALAVLAHGQGTTAVSERTQQALRDRLPKFDAARAEAQRRAAEERQKAQAARTEARVETNAAGEEVVVLPDFQVRERKLAQPTEDDWLKSSAITKKAIRLAEAEMSALELALNRWHIPLLTPSFAARARAAYEEKKRAEETERLDHLNRVGRLADGK